MAEFDGYETIKDLPTGDFRQKHIEAIRGFGEAVAKYISAHPDYNHWTKDDAVIEAVNVMTSNIDAAQAFLALIGVKINLYTYDFNQQEDNMTTHMNPIPVEKASSMKGIVITEKNRPMLAQRWSIPQFDWPEVLPLGYTLVVDFGNEGEIPFETVTPALFTETFNRLYDIENEFFSIERKVIIVPPTYDH